MATNNGVSININNEEENLTVRDLTRGTGVSTSEDISANDDFADASPQTDVPAPDFVNDWDNGTAVIDSSLAFDSDNSTGGSGTKSQGSGLDRPDDDNGSGAMRNGVTSTDDRTVGGVGSGSSSREKRS